MPANRILSLPITLPAMPARAAPIGRAPVWHRRRGPSDRPLPRYQTRRSEPPDRRQGNIRPPTLIDFPAWSSSVRFPEASSGPSSASSPAEARSSFWNCPLVRLKAFPLHAARNRKGNDPATPLLRSQHDPSHRPAGHALDATPTCHRWAGAPPDEPPGRPPQGHHHGVGNPRLPDRRRAAGSVPAVDPKEKGPAENGRPSFASARRGTGRSVIPTQRQPAVGPREGNKSGLLTANPKFALSKPPTH